MQHIASQTVNCASGIDSARQLCLNALEGMSTTLVEYHSVEQWQVEMVRKGLDALPLATSEYSIAVAELRNIWWYASHRDFGAARYELTMLTRRIRRAFSQDTVETRGPRRHSLHGHN